ncbi:MAG: HNH endonuclease [Chloroflexi bacterium]|nr:HNH endonuclease [Chloroflexota bacterium]
MVKKSDREAAWDRASKIRGKNPNLHRRDELGNPMYKPAYGKGGGTGWEIDHRNPKAKGGTDNPRNLRALNTTANRRKGDKAK